MGGSLGKKHNRRLMPCETKTGSRRLFGSFAISDRFPRNSTWVSLRGSSGNGQSVESKIVADHIEDFMQRITRTHHIGERTIFVVDGVFDSQFVQMVYPFMGRLPFTLSDYDTLQTKHILHWKYEFDLHALPANPLIRELISKTVALSQELYTPRTFHLKRMHCN